MYYQGHSRDDTKERTRILELAKENRRWGCGQIHDRLRLEGSIINHKKTARIYREENLMLYIRKRKKVAAITRIKLEAPRKPNEQWAMDFLSDCFYNGRRLRIFGVLDVFTRECLALEVDTSINGKRVTHVLNRIGSLRGLPETIVVDNGPEFAGKALDAWAFVRDVKLSFIRPGKPVDNAFIESFNGTFRKQCLNDNWFMSLPHAREIVEKWRIKYNTIRPHSSLGRITPEMFMLKYIKNNQLKVVQS